MLSLVMVATFVHGCDYVMLGKMTTAVLRQLAEARTPVETVHHRGLYRKIEGVASAAKLVSS